MPATNAETTSDFETESQPEGPLDGGVGNRATIETIAETAYPAAASVASAPGESPEVGVAAGMSGGGEVEACHPERSEGSQATQNDTQPVIDLGAYSDKEFISDAEAVEILRRSNSGVCPDLSRHGYRTVKRAFDIVFSGVAIVILLIPSIILSVVICIKSPGAGPFYFQYRVGRLKKDGSFRVFRMWKFRSMVPHADQMLEKLQEQNEADGPLFKIKEDPRIIPGIGPFIRKHSIDELPQLVNVFVGSMSLIGPRPPLPKEVIRYDQRAMHRLVCKSGCGGVWQVSERSNSTFESMVDMDLSYIKASSVKCDLSLIGKTIKAMLFGSGAY